MHWLCTVINHVYRCCEPLLLVYCLAAIVWKIIINKLIHIAIASTMWSFWKQIFYVKKDTLESNGYNKPLKYQKFKVSVLLMEFVFLHWTCGHGTFCQVWPRTLFLPACSCQTEWVDVQNELSALLNMMHFERLIKKLINHIIQHEGKMKILP